MTFHETRQWGLSDGSRLVNPQLKRPTELQLGMWALLNGQAYQILNLRVVGSGRIVEFRGHEPVLVTGHKALRVFTVDPPPAGAESARRPPFP